MMVVEERKDMMGLGVGPSLFVQWGSSTSGFAKPKPSLDQRSNISIEQPP
jgi:hypothetical protein